MAEVGPDALLAGGGEAALLLELNPVEPLLAAEAALLAVALVFVWPTACFYSFGYAESVNLLLTVLVLFASTWLALFLSKLVNRPVAALAAGKHVFLEKPMASTVADCDAIVAAAQAAPGYLMMGHICRFNPRYAAAREAISSVGQGRVGSRRRAFRRSST